MVLKTLLINFKIYYILYIHFYLVLTRNEIRYYNFNKIIITKQKKTRFHSWIRRLKFIRI